MGDILGCATVNFPALNRLAGDFCVTQEWTRTGCGEVKKLPHPYDIQGTQKDTNQWGQSEGEKKQRKAAGQSRKCMKNNQKCNEKSLH